MVEKTFKLISNHFKRIVEYFIIILLEQAEGKRLKIYWFKKLTSSVSTGEKLDLHCKFVIHLFMRFLI